VGSTTPVLTDYPTADRMLLAGLVFTEAAEAEVGPEALARLRAALEERATFFAAMPVFIVSGRH
jgi:hypothetical protein